MPKKNTADLSALLANQAGSTRNRPAPRAAATARSTDNSDVVGNIRGRMLGSHVPEEAKRQFDMLAGELGKKKEALHAEALNDLFAKYGKPELCPVTERSRRQRVAAE
jgi:hypothetical protein